MQLHGWEAVLFYVLAFMTLIMGVFVISARIAVHSALFLISALVNVALIFILLRAEFVAGVQILVYVGGVMVLFLFVIMLVQTRAEEESRVRLYTGQTKAVYVIAMLLAFAFIAAMRPAQSGFQSPDATAPTQTSADRGTATGQGAGGVSEDTQKVGSALYREAALPFEIASVLLLVAMVGAVMLARGSKQEKLYE
ncbi:MAG: NADH-ubiquinone/plastoquinone oxidoreductase chain 6 [Blastocatellia bacterium AA13]|nr:MAG: NADH-ubiquinone/plastoquinone oxidoreductase chain 6 [Blastocatellia bacterium AA13]